MKIPACTKCGRTGFIITSSGDRGYCDCPSGDLSRGLDSGRPRLDRQGEDTVRVLRILEYTGPRSKIESLVAKSIHGERRLANKHDPSRGVVIRAATIGQYPEILISNGGLEPQPEMIAQVEPPELMPICGDPSRDDGAF